MKCKITTQDTVCGYKNFTHPGQNFKPIPYSESAVIKSLFELSYKSVQSSVKDQNRGTSFQSIQTVWYLKTAFMKSNGSAVSS